MVPLKERVGASLRLVHGVRNRRHQYEGMATDMDMNIGMPPDVWGPIFWDAMHIVSLAYPVQPSEEDKAGAKAFFESLSVVLPCPICRTHYSEKIKASPVATGSKGELIYWVWDIHNQVNTLLGKPTITIEAFLERMREKRNTSPSMVSRTNGLYIAGGVLAGLLVGAGAVWALNKYGGKLMRGGSVSSLSSSASTASNVVNSVATLLAETTA